MQGCGTVPGGRKFLFLSQGLPASHSAKLSIIVELGCTIELLVVTAVESITWATEFCINDRIRLRWMVQFILGARSKLYIQIIEMFFIPLVPGEIFIAIMLGIC